MFQEWQKLQKLTINLDDETLEDLMLTTALPPDWVAILISGTLLKYASVSSFNFCFCIFSLFFSIGFLLYFPFPICFFVYFNAHRNAYWSTYWSTETVPNIIFNKMICKIIQDHDSSDDAFFWCWRTLLKQCKFGLFTANSSKISHHQFQKHPNAAI